MILLSNYKIHDLDSIDFSSSSILLCKNIDVNIFDNFSLSCHRFFFNAQTYYCYRFNSLYNSDENELCFSFGEKHNEKLLKHKYLNFIFALFQNEILYYKKVNNEYWLSNGEILNNDLNRINFNHVLSKNDFHVWRRCKISIFNY